MDPGMNEEKLQDLMKKAVQRLPGKEWPASADTEFIGRLYKVSEERKSIVQFMPIRRVREYALVAAMLLVCVTGYRFLFSPLVPSVANVSGTVKVFYAAKNEWAFVQGRSVRLAKNDILKTYGDGQADLVLPGVYHIRLKRDSEIRLARSVSRAVPGNVVYDMSKGKAFTFYDKARRVGRQFDIQTSEALVSVVGTDFMVEAVPNRTWVGVLDGMVKVTGNLPGIEKAAAASVLVEPGEKTLVRPGSAPEKPGRSTVNELIELEELYRIGTKPQVALLISTGKTRTRELLAATPLYVSSAKAGVLPAKMQAIITTFSRAVKTGDKDRYLENVRQFEALLEQYPDPKYNVQFSLFIAAYYAHLGEYARAVEAFGKVIEKYPDSSLTSIAQCAIGIICEEKLRDRAAAKAAYEKVIADYPESPEIDEARQGLERLSR